MLHQQVKEHGFRRCYCVALSRVSGVMVTERRGWLYRLTLLRSHSCQTSPLWDSYTVVDAVLCPDTSSMSKHKVKSVLQFKEPYWHYGNRACLWLKWDPVIPWQELVVLRPGSICVVIWFDLVYKTHSVLVHLRNHHLHRVKTTRLVYHWLIYEFINRAVSTAYNFNLSYLTGKEWVYFPSILHWYEGFILHLPRAKLFFN